MGSFDPGAELGPRLRQVREQRGLSVRELARRTQCSPSLISQIERGLSAPSVGMLYALATELRTSLDFLFSAAAPADGLTVTAHGDGHVRAGRPAGAGDAGHAAAGEFPRGQAPLLAHLPQPGAELRAGIESHIPPGDLGGLTATLYIR